MCGRFVSSSQPDEIAKYFGADVVGETLLAPNHNTAPTSQVLVVRDRREPDAPETTSRTLELLYWGLIPIWAKDRKIGAKMINARSETLAEKNSFKRSYAKKRCILPVDGFYEWEPIEGQKAKQPWFIYRPDGEPFAFAGLWETWRGPDRDGSETVHSCTIITGPPNDKMAEIHHRMPAILPPDAWDLWLDPDVRDIEQVAPLLKPAPSELIAMHRVSADVNNARNKGEHLMAAIS